MDIMANIFLTFPPSAPFFPPSGWLSLNILLLLKLENPHQLALPLCELLFHSSPAQLWFPPFW